MAVIFGISGSFADTLTGSDAVDSIFGLSGNDRLSGGFSGLLNGAVSGTSAGRRQRGGSGAPFFRPAGTSQTGRPSAADFLRQ